MDSLVKYLLLSRLLGAPQASVRAIASRSTTEPAIAEVADATWADENAEPVAWNRKKFWLQPQPLPAMWAVKVDKNTPMDQTSFEADQDDTVAVSVTNGTRWNNTNVAVSKLGRSTNVYNAEAWGFNSAVHIANGTHAFLDGLNVTSHNGAIGIFAYGRGTQVLAQSGQVASTGPVGHAIVAAAGAGVKVSGLTMATGGMRSTIGVTWGVGSSLDIRESTASTAGLGSPCLCSGSGSVLEVRNLTCDAMRAPFLVMDASRGGRDKAGGPTVFLDGVDGSAGRLAAVLIFNNMSSAAAVNSTLPIANVTTKAKATATATPIIRANITTTTTTTTKPNSTTTGVTTAKSTAAPTKTSGPQPSAKAKEVAGLTQDQLHSPAKVVIKDSEIRMKDKAVAGIWIGNSWASVTISRSSLVLEHSDADDAVVVGPSSRVLVRAGGAVPTRDMDGFTEEPRRPQQRQRQPHVIRAEESTLGGDVLAAGDGSWVHLRLMSGSTWVGTATQSGDGSRVDVSLAATSSWTMTGEAHVRRLRLEGDVPNIDSRGFMLYYNAAISGMAGTFDLPGGGRAVAVDM